MNLTEQDKKDIVDLVNSGYDIKQLAFDMEMSENELIKLIEVYNKKDKTPQRPKKVVQKSQKTVKPNKAKQSTINKMSKIRTNYRKIYDKDDRDNSKQVSSKKEISKADKELIEQSIVRLKTLNQKLEKVEYKEPIIRQIIKETMDIQKKPLTIEQIEYVQRILDGRFYTRQQTTVQSLTSQRAVYTIKLAEAIQEILPTIDSIDELKKLSSKIPRNSRSPRVSTIKSNITTKIFSLQKKTIVKNRDASTIPAELKEIAKDIANGNLDVEKARDTINKQVEKEEKMVPDSKFKLNHKQQYDRVVEQVVRLLERNNTEYKIQDPEIAIEQLTELFRSRTQGLEVVLENLIEQKRYSEVNKICICEIRKDDTEDFEQLKTFRKRAIQREIGDMILERIKSQPTPDDDAFVDMIEEKVDKFNTKLSAIPLGKNKDGSRLISLQDVWYDREVKKQISI